MRKLTRELKKAFPHSLYMAKDKTNFYDLEKGHSATITGIVMYKQGDDYLMSVGRAYINKTINVLHASREYDANAKSESEYFKDVHKFCGMAN